jgi:hypothetical protein
LVQCCCQRYAGSMDFADEVSRRKGPPLTECHAQLPPPPPFAKRVLEREQWLRAWQVETMNPILNHTHLHKQMKIPTSRDKRRVLNQ